MSEPESNNNEQTRPATATATERAGAGAGTGTGTGAGKGNWNFFGTGPKTEDKSKEPEKDYIDKFERQTTFIFYEQEEKRGPTFGLQEQPASLKVILRGLYNEYYKKMMDGVLEFTNENELNEDVKNMFKRALQALAEKKRIDNAAPPYEFEDSKSVISQMVLYDDEGKDKRLPILIYDPCIFELENEVKPSIDVEEFHNTIRKIFDKVELVGLMNENMIEDTNLFVNMDVERKGGGKYVGGETLSLKKVLEKLNDGLLNSNEYHFKDGFTDYTNKLYTYRKESMKVRDKIRRYLTGSPPPTPLIKELNDYIFKNVSVGRSGYKYRVKDILKIIILHFAGPEIEAQDPRTQDQKQQEKKGDEEKVRTGVAEAEKTALASSVKKNKDVKLTPEEQETAAINMWEAIQTANYLSVNLLDKIESEQTFTTFLNTKFLKSGNEELKKLGENIIQLLKNVGIQYEGVRSTTRYESMTKGLAKRLGWKGEEEEEVPEDILLKDMLKYGVWRLRPEIERQSQTENPTLYYMVRLGMLNYLITGENVINYDEHKNNKDDFYNIDESNAKPQNFFGLCFASVNFIGFLHGKARFFEIGNTQKRKQKTIYGKQFHIDEFLRDVDEEDIINNFKKSDWYKAATTTDTTYMGGQSKNTTAKKNKSKRNKSKKNK